MFNHAFIFYILFTCHTIKQCIVQMISNGPTQTSEHAQTSGLAHTSGFVQTNKFVHLSQSNQRSRSMLWKPIATCCVKYVKRGLAYLFAWCGMLFRILPAILMYRRNKCGESLRHQIEKAGPSFVKIAQWISQRPDIAGQELCDALEPLTDQHPTHSWDVTVDLLNQELFSETVEELLKHMNPEPIGSGSVAQVYKSRLVDATGTTRDVAVKILHPNIRESLWAGSKVLATMSWLLSVPLDWSGFKKSVMRQTDLRVEADNILQFQHNFAHLDFVIFPTIFLATPSVLVESYEQGEPWEIFGQKHPQFHDECVILRLACFWKMGFHDNFLHSDMHRGNLLFRIHHASLQVVFLDAGVVSCVQDERLLQDFLRVLFAFRMEGMARIMMRVNLNKDADLYGFLVDVTNYRQVLRKSGILTFDIAKYLRQKHDHVFSMADSGVQPANNADTVMDSFRNDSQSDLLNALAHYHPWLRNLEYEETPFMEIPGPHFQKMFQHITSSMKKHQLVVNGDVLMLLFGFLLSESYALNQPTPSLLLDAIFYMKERNMVDIDTWLEVPWEWLLHVKRLLKNSHEATVLRATDAPLCATNASATEVCAVNSPSILDTRYNQGRPSVQAVSIDASAKWDLLMQVHS